MRAVLPSRLRRLHLSAWGILLARSLATAGLLLAVVLAAASHRGLLTLVFLTATCFVAVGVVRAYLATRYLATASRIHRSIKDALSPLGPRGWRLKHNVCWPDGPGDGHLAVAPAGGLAFVVKDCRAPIGDFDLSRAQELATALSRAGCHYIPICVALASDARSFSERGVICCTPGQLVAELLDAERAFAVSLFDEAAQHQLLYSESSAA